MRRPHYLHILYHNGQTISGGNDNLLWILTGFLALHAGGVNDDEIHDNARG
jgi:hypothetical protein